MPVESDSLEIRVLLALSSDTGTKKLIAEHGAEVILGVLARAADAATAKVKYSRDMPKTWVARNTQQLARIERRLAAVRELAGRTRSARRPRPPGAAAPGWPAWIASPSNAPEPKPSQASAPAEPLPSVRDRYPSDSVHDQIWRLWLLNRRPAGRIAAIVGVDIKTVREVLAQG